jgi:chromosome segregation ATPase
MPTVDDPEFVESLQKLFASRGDLKTLVEYQQRLYASLKELNNNHQVIHNHVKELTLSHNTLRSDANGLMKLKGELNDRLRSLSDSHAKTRGDIQRAIESINYIQHEVRKIPELEKRLVKLEEQTKHLWRDEQINDKKVQEQEQRLKKLERQ